MVLFGFILIIVQLSPKFYECTLTVLFGEDLISVLREFYGKSYVLSARNNEFSPKVVDTASLVSDYKVFKIFAFKERFNYERLREELERALTCAPAK